MRSAAGGTNTGAPRVVLVILCCSCLGSRFASSSRMAVLSVLQTPALFTTLHCRGANGFNTGLSRPSRPRDGKWTGVQILACKQRAQFKPQQKHLGEERKVYGLKCEHFGGSCNMFQETDRCIQTQQPGHLRAPSPSWEFRASAEQKAIVCARSCSNATLQTPELHPKGRRKPEDFLVSLCIWPMETFA